MFCYSMSYSKLFMVIQFVSITSNHKKKNEQYITYLAIYFAISFYERLLLEI